MFSVFVIISGIDTIKKSNQITKKEIEKCLKGLFIILKIIIKTLADFL